MRKLFLTFFLFLVLGMPIAVLMNVSSVMAAPAYGTAMPQKEGTFWGLQHYYVDRRNLDNDQGVLHSHQNYLTMSYGVLDWLSLDLKLSLYSTFRHNSADGSQMRYDRSVWGGGYGFRIKLHEKGPWKTVTGFQHFSIHPMTVKKDGRKNNGILEDWQFSLLESYKMKYVTPYAGVRYTVMDYIHTLDNERNRINSDDARRFGLILGADIPLSPDVWLNFESDWQDGGSATGGVHFRF
jgi:hypothetical protein